MTSGFTSWRVPDSMLARLDPRWKLAGLGIVALMVVSLRTLPAVLAALALSLLLVFLGRLPRSWYCRRVAPVVLLVGLFVVWLPLITEGPAVSVGPVQLSEDGLMHACRILAKALTVFNLMLALWTTTPLETTLKAAHCLGLPGLVVQLLGMTYRFIFLLRDEFRRLRIALRTRGFRRRASLHTYRTFGHVAGSLLVRSHERAERVSQAMQCRGFDGRYRAVAIFQTQAKDVIFLACVCMTGAALLAWDILSLHG